MIPNMKKFMLADMSYSKKCDWSSVGDNKQTIAKFTTLEDEEM